jgi:hypothetical protein
MVSCESFGCKTNPRVRQGRLHEPGFNELIYSSILDLLGVLVYD